jgi:hypothetical protein
MKKSSIVRLNLASFVEVSGLSKPRIYSAVEDGQLTRNQDGTFTVSGRRNQKFLRELGIDPSKIKAPTPRPLGRKPSPKPSAPKPATGPGAETLRVSKIVHQIVELREKTAAKRAEFVARSVVENYLSVLLENSVCEFEMFVFSVCDQIKELYPDTTAAQMVEVRALLDVETEIALTSLRRTVADFWKRNRPRKVHDPLAAASMPGHLAGIHENKLYSLQKSEIRMIRDLETIQASRLKIAVARRELIPLRSVKDAHGRIVGVYNSIFHVIPIRTADMIGAAINQTGAADIRKIDRFISDATYATVGRIQTGNLGTLKSVCPDGGQD